MVARPEGAVPVLVEALGTVIAIEAHPDDVAAILDAWSGAIVDPPRSAQLRTRPTRTVTAARPLDLAGLSTAVTLAAIESRRGQAVLLHACGLATDDGRVIAFVAASGTGKTTLAHLLGTALAYVTDETVSVEPDGTVLPYRKPLSIIEHPLRAKRQRSAVALDLRELPERPLRIARIVLLERDAGWLADDPQLDRPALLEALPHLVPQLSHLAAMPDGLASIADLADRVGGIRRVRYREAEQVLAALGELLDPRDSPHPEPITRISTGDGVAPRGGWARAAGVQALDDGDRVAAFSAGVLRILDGAGAAVWRALEHPASTADLTAAVVAAVGPPPDGDAESRVRAAAAELVAVGLLTGR